MTVVLDTGPLGLLCHPSASDAAAECRKWLRAVRAAGRWVFVPEVADFEYRREAIRRDSRRTLANLDKLGVDLGYLPITTAVMRRAAELWAQARATGRPTASDLALDCDVILAAQALALGGSVVVATSNPAHLTRCVAADLWQNIPP